MNKPIATVGFWSLDVERREERTAGDLLESRADERFNDILRIERFVFCSGQDFLNWQDCIYAETRINLPKRLFVAKVGSQPINRELSFPR